MEIEPRRVQCLEAQSAPDFGRLSTLPTQVAAGEKLSSSHFWASSDLGVMLLFLRTFFGNFLGQIKLNKLFLFVYTLRSCDLSLSFIQWKNFWPHVSFMKKCFHQWL